MSAVPSQTMPGSAPSRRGWLAFGILVATVVAAVLAWQHLQRPDTPSSDAVAADTYKDLLSELDFRFHVPAVNPASYRLLGLSGDLTNGRSNMMSIDYRERQSGDFVTATEGTPSWMISALGGGHPWGAQTINGLVWTKYR